MVGDGGSIVISHSSSAFLKKDAVAQILNRYRFLQIFQPYAKQWLPVLTQLIISGNHGGEGLHYFVVDIIVTMLSWATTAVLEVRGKGVCLPSKYV